MVWLTIFSKHTVNLTVTPLIPRKDISIRDQKELQKELPECGSYMILIKDKCPRDFKKETKTKEKNKNKKEYRSSRTLGIWVDRSKCVTPIQMNQSRSQTRVDMVHHDWSTYLRVQRIHIQQEKARKDKFLMSHYSSGPIESIQIAGKTWDHQ